MELFILRRITAHRIVTGITKRLLLVNLNTVAIAIAPNAVCDSPSPINEKRFNTSVTPSNEAATEIKTLTMNAFLTSSTEKYDCNVEKNSTILLSNL